ncbi:MAG: DUF5615 family PIN-like protein [Thermodesulfobacteriota bacterium]
MKLLIDMNLSPQWVPVLTAAGWEAVHWSSIGRPTATDHEIFEYAKSHGCVIFTHDLDFGAILAATNADYPSVIQVRAQDVTPEHLSGFVTAALHQFKQHLDAGALVTIDDKKSRARILPLRV